MTPTDGFGSASKSNDSLRREIAAVKEEANRNIDALKREIATVREELYSLTLHLIPRPPAREPESVYESATRQSVVREQPKE